MATFTPAHRQYHRSRSLGVFGAPVLKAMMWVLMWVLMWLLTGVLAPQASAAGAAPGDDTVVQAREALRKKDRAALAAARTATAQQRHPLAMWADYWELGNRLGEAQQAELEAFYVRWPGSYVEDRLRNDWLLELGRRRDWANLRIEFPRFRMNDDREVTCYALLAQHLEGQDVRVAAREAWFAQRDLDDGCALMARTLYTARIFTAADAWHEARLSLENNRPRAMRAAVVLVDAGLGKAADELLDSPARFLNRPLAGGGSHGHELLLLALMQAAASDPDYAAAQLQAPKAQRLSMAQEATAWAHIAKQSALKLQPQAAEHARHAWKLWDAANKPGVQPPWSDDLLAWHVRAALRRPASDPERWALVARATEAMSVAEQRQDSWVYWKARATLARASAGPEGDGARGTARAALASISTQLSFYGKLATEELGETVRLPAAPAQLAGTEREASRGHGGLARALHLITLGLRSEGVREWNFSLRGMTERELLAAAQWACEREVWDRCINTSERTRTEVDMAQRFPMPFREQVLSRAAAAGLDPAVLLGLIRQESRFITDARSGVGASGLMQLMPATARWTAKKVGLDYTPEMINDPAINLQLGAAYLKLVLDDFGGSLAMAAAAYNAGPGRPRRWREGGSVMEPAAWAESIPFNETRDYVKKVLSNSVYYGALLASGTAPLKVRLGPPVGPRGAPAGASDRDLP